MKALCCLTRFHCYSTFLLYHQRWRKSAPSILINMITKHYEFILPPCTTNHPSGSDTFVTRKLVPSFNVQTVSRSSSKSDLRSTLPMHPYKFLLPSQKYLHGHHFFLLLTLFLWACVNPKILFSQS